MMLPLCTIVFDMTTLSCLVQAQGLSRNKGVFLDSETETKEAGTGHVILLLLSDWAQHTDTEHGRV